ncbi:unnamed protein product [Didymodactylos carnosus]|uniref:Uncharacterized protein n=1 Tax=Didymodactylos carnosus TaxID=1234261 RepID=A0A815GQI2_9BILA|nr:unnamed protein product [Didymodactylos carnosus]CAF4206720.1 unnamed protein product [Didymodactylos carnosus]
MKDPVVEQKREIEILLALRDDLHEFEQHCLALRQRASMEQHQEDLQICSIRRVNVNVESDHRVECQCSSRHAASLLDGHRSQRGVQSIDRHFHELRGSMIGNWMHRRMKLNSARSVKNGIEYFERSIKSTTERKKKGNHIGIVVQDKDPSGISPSDVKALELTKGTFSSRFRFEHSRHSSTDRASRHFAERDRWTIARGRNNFDSFRSTPMKSDQQRKTDLLFVAHLDSTKQLED